MEFSADKFIEDIGFGPWQILTATCVCLFQISSAIQYINTVFVNRLNVTSCYNVFYQNLSKEERGYYQYELNSSEIAQYGDNCESVSPYIASFTYESTFSSEFELIGDRAWISSLYQMIFVLGIILGNTVSGISDIIGRLTLIRWGLVGYLIGNILVSLSPNIYVILVSRFLIGFTHEIFQTPAFTLLMEITPIKQRSILGIMVIFPYSLGGVLIGGLAYLIRPWRLFHLISSVPVFLLPISVFFLTKSPRWLISQNRLEEAADVIEKSAKVNKGKVPSRDNLISILNTIVIENSKTIGNSNETSNKSKIQLAIDFIQLFFASATMCRISLITPALWMVTGLVYFGITLNANNFAASNIYLYISLLHLCELLPIVGTSLVINRLGNILTSTILYVSAGVCLLNVIILPDIWWLKWPLVIVAFMASGTSFVLCYVMASELYPTVVRSTGSSFCSLTNNLGTLLASYLFEIVAQKVWWVPKSVCVVFCLIATIILQFLPDTNGQPLCETLEHIKERDVNLVSENTQQGVENTHQGVENTQQGVENTQQGVENTQQGVERDTSV